MVSKTQWRVISVVLAVVLLLAALMTGLTGITDGIMPVGEVRDGYARFKGTLDTLEENEKALADGKAQYDEKKAAYDEKKSAYDEKSAQYDEANAEYNESVLSYNQQLLAYSVGKNALGSSAGSALGQGRSQLDSGWEAYNNGTAALETGKAEFEAKKQEYEKGKAAYEQLLSSISALEDKYIPHKLALKIVGAKLGINLTDEYLAQMKSQLDAAEGMITQGEKQMSDAQAQLDAAHSELQKGEAGYSQAQQQLKSAEARLGSMKSEIDAGPAQLDADGKALSELKSELDAEKEELDAAAEELSAYEDVEKKAERTRETLIDEGYGSSENTTAELLSAAREHEGALRGVYLKALLSFITTYAAHLLSVAAAATALIMLAKKDTRAGKLALAGAILGAVSVIASLVYGTVDTLAFAAAVLSLVGVSLIKTEEA